MQVNSEWFPKLRYAFSIFKRLIDIQHSQPTQEEANSLLLALADLGMTKETIEENSLKAVQIFMGRILHELHMSEYDVTSAEPGIPSSLVSTLEEMVESLTSRHDSIKRFFSNGEFNSNELILILTPNTNDTISDSKVYDEFKELYHLFIQELMLLVERDLSKENNLQRFEMILEDAEITEYILKFFDLVDYDEETPMEVTLGDLKNHINRVDEEVVAGLENFSSIFDRYVEVPDVAGLEANFMDSLKNGLKKVADGIAKALKSLIDFFSQQKRDMGDRKKELIDTCNKNIDEIKALSDDTHEMVEGVPAKIVGMFEKAELTECAGFFKSVSDKAGIVTAFNNAVRWLNQNADKTSDADAALNDAGKASSQLTSFNPNITEDSSSDEKAAVKDEKNSLVDKAKGAMAIARDKLKGSLTPMAALAKLPAIIKGSVKPKPKVAGVEAWEL